MDAPPAAVHLCYKSNTTGCQHLEMQTNVPLDPTHSLYHILSVMHETGGSKMDGTSHSHKHWGP